jgi:hypothetical protein
MPGDSVLYLPLPLHASTFGYVSEILLSHAGGALADRAGARQMLIGLSVGTAAALGLIAIPKPVIWADIWPRSFCARYGGRAGTRARASSRMARHWRGGRVLAGGLLFQLLQICVFYAGAALLFGKPTPAVAAPRPTTSVGGSAEPDVAVITPGGSPASPFVWRGVPGGKGNTARPPDFTAVW